MRPVVPLSVSLRKWFLSPAEIVSTISYQEPIARETNKLYMQEYLLHALDEELSFKQIGALDAPCTHFVSSSRIFATWYFT